MFDLRFKHPSTYLIAGSSQSGKTTFVMNILRNIEIIENGKDIKNILYFYKEWQPIFDKAYDEKLVTNFLNYIPTVEDIREKTFYYSDKGGSIIIIDDYMQEVTDDIVTLYTTLSHHLNISAFLLTQNLFSKSKGYRDISLNSTYIVLMKNPRDASQIVNFARQIAPGKSRFINSVYKEATRHPHSYLIFDNHQKTPDILRIRSRIFPHEFPIRVWMERTCNI